MNKITKYLNYLASAVFGITMAMLFTEHLGFEESKYTLAASLSIIWVFPLLRVDYLSEKLKKFKEEKLTGKYYE
jgi:hypothetical protein